MQHTTIPRRSPATVLTVSAACLFACFASLAPAADDDAADKIDPCKLITQAEAQSAVGKPVKPGRFVGGLYRSCAFDHEPGGTYQVSIRLISIDKATFDRVDPRDFERITGTDLDAFFATDRGFTNFWHAGVQVTIQVHFEDNAGQSGERAAELKLATLAAKRF